MKNDSPKCFCGLKADGRLFPARLWKWFPRGKPLFQNTVSAEVRWTEASCSLCVDPILMVSILSSMHVRAILRHKRCRVFGKRPGEAERSLTFSPRNWDVFRPSPSAQSSTTGRTRPGASQPRPKLTLVVLCDSFCFLLHMYRRMNNETLS